MLYAGLVKVCVLYAGADRLMANGKKLIMKYTAGRELFKNKAPDLPLRLQ
jgi:hypothetical protein